MQLLLCKYMFDLKSSVNMDFIFVELHCKIWFNHNIIPKNILNAISFNFVGSFYKNKKHQEEKQNYPNNFAWHFSLDYMITSNGIYCKELMPLGYSQRLPISVLLRHICRYIWHSIRLLKNSINRKRIQFNYLCLDFISHFPFTSSLTIAYFSISLSWSIINQLIVRICVWCLYDVCIRWNDLIIQHNVLMIKIVSGYGICITSCN